MKKSYLPGGIKKVIAKFFAKAFQRPFICLNKKNRITTNLEDLSYANNLSNKVYLFVGLIIIVRLLNF